MAYYDDDGNPVDLDNLKVTATVDGEEQELTLSEMRARAQKASAADKRLEEASRLRREAEEYKKANENAVTGFNAFREGLQGNDPDKLRAFAKSLQWTDEQFDEWYAEAQKQLAAQNGQLAPQNNGRQMPNVDPSKLDKALKFIDALDKRGVSPEQFIETTGVLAGERFNSIVEDRLSKAIRADATLAQRVSNDEGMKLVLKEVRRNLSGRQRPGQAFSDDDYIAAVRETAEFVRGVSPVNSNGVGSAADIYDGYPTSGPKGKRPSVFDSSPEAEDWFHQKMIQDHKKTVGMSLA